MSDQKVVDDLEAVRTIVETLKQFKPEEQQRILRWVSEKTGLPQVAGTFQVPVAPTVAAPAVGPAAKADGTQQDIKTFVDQKSPRSDVQFAATVAYYLRFEAPPAERKEYIEGDDLQQACRKAKRDRLVNPYQTLKNAHNLGLLDKGPEKATFVINTVGENLVAMSLPGGANSTDKDPRRRTAKRASKASTRLTKTPAKKSVKPAKRAARA
jgi:hypothetical protein